MAADAFSTWRTQRDKPYQLLAHRIYQTTPELLLSCIECILHRCEHWNTDHDCLPLCSRWISWNTKERDSGTPLLALHTTWASHQGSWLLVEGFSSFTWSALWLEAFHRLEVVWKHLHSTLDTETPPFGLLLAKSGRRPHDDSIVGTHVYDPSSLLLGVQRSHLRGCEAGGYGQRSASGDASSQTWNLIRRQDIVQCLTRSAFDHHQHNNTLQPQKDCSKGCHFPIPRICPKWDALSRLPNPPLLIDWHVIDWKHPSDNETSPDDTPCTRACPEYCTGTVASGGNTLSSGCATGLLWIESIGLPKGVKESPRWLEQPCARVLSSHYQPILSPGYMACWIKRSHDMDASRLRVGSIHQSWYVVWGGTLPCRWNAWAYRDSRIEDYRVRWELFGKGISYLRSCLVRFVPLDLQDIVLHPLSLSHLSKSRVLSFGRIAQSLSNAMTMNCLLQTMITVLRTQGSGASWWRASESFRSSQQSMRRW